jgi:hypothetical protein
VRTDCPDCFGSGDDGDGQCPTCGSTGRVCAGCLCRPCECRDGMGTPDDAPEREGDTKDYPEAQP